LDANKENLYVVALFVANMLLLRWERAGRIAQVAEETLNKIYPQGISEGYGVVEKWISEEEHSYKCSPSVPGMYQKKEHSFQ